MNRFGILVVCVTVLFAAAIPAATNDSQKDDTPSTNDTLEEGAGKDLVVKKCTVCHDLERIPARRRDRTGWEDVVDNMKSRGADITPDERQTIVDYLTAHYGIPD